MSDVLDALVESVDSNEPDNKSDPRRLSVLVVDRKMDTETLERTFSGKHPVPFYRIEFVDGDDDHPDAAALKPKPWSRGKGPVWKRGKQ